MARRTGVRFPAPPLQPTTNRPVNRKVQPAEKALRMLLGAFVVGSPARVGRPVPRASGRTGRYRRRRWIPSTPHDVPGSSRAHTGRGPRGLSPVGCSRWRAWWCGTGCGPRLWSSPPCCCWCRCPGARLHGRRRTSRPPMAHSLPDRGSRSCRPTRTGRRIERDRSHPQCARAPVEVVEPTRMWRLQNGATIRSCQTSR